MRGIVLLPLLAALSLPSSAAEPAAFDHGAFDALLREHVHAGRVDYDAFQAAPSFRAYLDALERAAPDALPEAERLAFWINTYNAYTIQLVVQHGERESIRNINKGLLGKGPWKEPLVRAAGRQLSLDDVEHGLIRQQFKEPRIHFALVCAAVSCPPLRSEAYTGARLDEQLDQQTHLFLLRSPAQNRVDVAARRVYLSPIFDWYGGDFGGGRAAIGRFVAAYYPPGGPERMLLESGDFDLKHSAYDWSLNSAARVGAPR